MKIIKIIIWLIIGFVLGYSVIPVTHWMKDERDEVVSITRISCGDIPPKEELIPLVKQGDTAAYDELWRYFSCSRSLKELLPYSFLMANKYNYKRAYFDVFYSFWSLYSEMTYSLSLLDSLDETTRTLALEYLQKGAALGSSSCNWDLGSYYFEGKYFEKDTILGQKLKDKSWGKKVSE